MFDTKRILEDAQRRAPRTPFRFHDVVDRRARQAQRRRLSATIVGLSLTAAIVGGAAFTMMVSKAGQGPLVRAGAGLPAPARIVTLGPGQYSYQRIRIQAGSGVDLHVQSWWASDDSGRIDVLQAHDYGIQGGSFGPGQFPDEGDLAAFPTDPAALQTFLLQRSGPDGSSPRPDVTPAPGMPLADGQLWLAIHDYLGSTQYLNATPELRATMLQVLAQDPIVRVDSETIDPLGRPATTLSFHAYDAEVSVFVAPGTGDFLALTERFDGGGTDSVAVEDAGIVANDHALPHATQRTVSPPS